MKKLIFVTLMIFLASAIFTHLSFAGAKATKVGSFVSVKRMLDGNDKITLLRFVDPANPFVAIFFTHVKSGKIMKMADPSNASIAARLIKPVPLDKDGKMIINKESSINIASVSKSWMSKVMKIARFYDSEMNTLCYIVYTNKIIGGSAKHSLSVVPLGMPLTP